MRWYLHLQLSDRAVAEIAWELGVVASGMILRWVVRYVEVLAQRGRAVETGLGWSWRANETYGKVRGQWMYLYRGVEQPRKTVESYLIGQSRPDPSPRLSNCL